MSISTLPNGRDLGGFSTTGGGRVAQGLLFRGSAPVNPEMQQSLAAISISTVFDLRTDLERHQTPDLVPPETMLEIADVLADAPDAGAASLGGIATAALTKSTTHNRLTATEVHDLMLRSYRYFVELPSAQRAFAQVIARLLRPDGGAVLFHCTAGKDRTGWLAAVLLQALGVSRDDALADYLASGPAVEAMFAPYFPRLIEKGVEPELLRPALAVTEEYFDTAMDSVAENFGSLPNYLAVLGLDDAALALLRQRFVT